MLQMLYYLTKLITFLLQSDIWNTEMKQHDIYMYVCKILIMCH